MALDECLCCCTVPCLQKVLSAEADWYSNTIQGRFLCAPRTTTALAAASRSTQHSSKRWSRLPAQASTRCSHPALVGRCQARAVHLSVAGRQPTPAAGVGGHDSVTGWPTGKANSAYMWGSMPSHMAHDCELFTKRSDAQAALAPRCAASAAWTIRPGNSKPLLCCSPVPISSAFHAEWLPIDMDRIPMCGVIIILAGSARTEGPCLAQVSLFSGAVGPLQ